MRRRGMGAAGRSAAAFEAAAWRIVPLCPGTRSNLLVIAPVACSSGDADPAHKRARAHRHADQAP
ncbi:hypothetical protein BSIN_2516 [Burkholderia singularis]|uniref:Uncharacterized protein n=1 Tax=Burkholderia singularis TaxID=1503053 RepID=A0A238H2J4_9BURK|nr:hypothetical protein BSIN_2516 [Burkholderia singularis]